MSALVLKPTHKAQWLDFAELHIQNPEIWSIMVFSDKKKFNLDGPDGFQFFWQDLRKMPDVMAKQQSGGGGLMVWAAFSCQGKTQLCFMEGTMNTIKYC